MPTAILLLLLAAVPAAAQTDSVTTPPPNLVLSNYNSTPVGPFGGLEGVAFIARIADPSSAWFNPAGLARRATAQISGSAGVYQRTAVATVALPNEGGSTQQLPNFVGFTFSPRRRVTVGAAFLATNAWSQETDSELISSDVSGQRRFAYSADSAFDQRVGAIGAGYFNDGAWRAGGGLAFSLMSLRQVQSVSERIATPESLRSLLVTARASSSALQLRAQAGVQYDRQHWQFGAAIRTPAATINRSGVVTLDGLADEGTGSLGASVFDVDAASEYRLPWEFQGGAAFVADRVQLEIDVQAYSAVPAYTLLATNQPLVIYSHAEGAAPPVVMTRPFTGFTAAADGIANISAGGHLVLLADRELRLHAGVGVNHSPVAAADTIFTRVDLTTWSLGASGAFGRLRFSIGIHRQAGHADDIPLRNLLNGDVVRTRIDVRLTGMIYSLSYEF
jgi:hypothetical protein